MSRILISLFLALSIVIPALAASPPTEAETDSLPRPVTGVYGIQFGALRALSTYLSPLPYRGTETALYGNWRKAMPFSPEHAMMEFDANAGIGRSINQAHTAAMLDLDVNFSWGIDYRMRLPHSLQWSAGGRVAVNGGMLWLTRNGNNPVAARAFANLGFNTALTWHTRVWRLPVLISESFGMPLAGAFFSPEYGETYYEIYLGNHTGLAHFGWPGNHFSATNLLSVFLDFGRTAMQIGYRFSADTSWTNGINTHIFRHFLVIGVVPGGLGLKNRRPAVNAYYL